MQTPSGPQTPQELKAIDCIIIAVHPDDSYYTFRLPYSVGRFMPKYSPEDEFYYSGDGRHWIPGTFTFRDEERQVLFFGVAIVPIKMIRFTEQFGDQDRLVATRMNHDRYIFLNAMTNFRDSLNAIVGDETPMPDLFETSCPELFKIWELMNATD